MRNIQVAIDGTAGVGKTTIGQMLAARLGCAYLDTGAMYRAVSLQALKHKVSPADHEGMAALARSLDFVSRDATPAEAADLRQYTVLVGGQDVSQILRSPEVEAIVSQVAAIPSVRAALVEKQREIANKAGTIVMIGRDIGSVVLKEADLKIYLDASPEVRAQRRSQQNTAITTEQARANLANRDDIDSHRTVSPLVITEDAVYINTDQLSQGQVLELINIELAKILEQETNAQ